MKGTVNAALSFALDAVLVASCSCAASGKRSRPPAGGAATAPVDRAVTLGRDLPTAEQRVRGEGDAVEVRGNLVDLHDQAPRAPNRLGRLSPTGRLRSSTLTASEVLAHALGGPIYEVQNPAVSGLALGRATRRRAGLRGTATHGPGRGPTFASPPGSFNHACARVALVDHRESARDGS